MTHDFGAAGIYTIQLRGIFPRIFFNADGDRQKLLNVSQWGGVAWTSMQGAFDGCTNLNISATDLPNLSGVTSMESMFKSCSSLNGPANINSWNTANVTNMSFIFAGATSFNQFIFGWNTAKVTNMRALFAGATSFRESLNIWNVTAVTDMSDMFSRATSFNGSLSTWTLHPLVNMSGMLDNCGMDCGNYGSTLRGWSNNPATPNGCVLGAFGRRYPNEISSIRANLLVNKRWLIIGDAGGGGLFSEMPTAMVLEMEMPHLRVPLRSVLFQIIAIATTRTQTST